MESKGVIFEGKTLDDAVRKGLEALGLPRAEVMIQVMEEGSGGFLGIGSRPYKVRMMPRPRRETGERSERRPGRDRDRGGRGGRDRERQGRGERSERGGERRARGERGERGPRGERVERGERGGRHERGGRPEREGRSPEAQSEPAARSASGPREMAPLAEPRDEATVDQGGRRRRRRREGGGRNGDEGRERAPRPRPEGREEIESRGDGSRESRGANGPLMPPDELAATSKQLAEDLFRHMGFEVQVSARAEADSVEVRAEIGQDSELITGEKGEVRQSIQHVLNRMLNRGGTTHYHLQLEINDFWARRESELQELARQLANEAVTDGSEKLTEYLNAQERRVIHVALRDDPRVRTFGIGDGLIKKVAVAPAGAEQELKPEY
jgi:predicted RNA-binding protein Jag